MASAVKLNMTEGWNKWQLGLVVGVGALGVAGLWYYMRRKGEVKVDKLDIVDSNQNASNKPSAKPKSLQEQAQESKKEGNVFFKNGQYNAAISCYTEAINLCPREHSGDIATFHQNRAAAFEQLGENKSVLDDLNMAITLNKRYPKALARRARAHEVAQDYAMALEDITACCLLEGFQNQQSLIVADRVLKLLGKSKAHAAYSSRTPSLPSQFFIKNYFAGFCHDPIFKTSNAGKAEPLKKPDEEEITEEPVVNGEAEGATQESSPFELAQQQVNQQQYRQLIELCSKELELKDTPHRHKALLMRGTMYVLYGQGEEAMKDLSTLLEIDGVETEVHVNALVKMGSLVMQADKSQEALAFFSKAETVDPNNSDVFHHRGQQLLLVEKLDDAIKDFDKSISLSPDFATSYVQRAYAEHRSAVTQQSPLNLMKADASFKQALEKFPNCSDIYLLYGQAQCDQGDFTRAEELFTRAESLEPDNANILVHRGLLCLQTSKDANQALTIIRRAVEVDPLCEYAHEIIGTIEVQRTNMQAAEYHFNKAIELSKSEAEMAHLFSLLHASQIQTRVAQKLGIDVPTFGP
ncbi:mitochondrial import receptor subunit TOM70-like [Haliotis cracherodii]|uniref:mitochondrial import receptor subunit TOM70-like n=1 Tax=Haliotis cracherodii TaxID=6455 RepID=UPI0039EBADD4